MSRVTVIVRGGIVQAAYSDAANIDIEVIDLDDTDDESEQASEEALSAATQRCPHLIY